MSTRLLVPMLLTLLTFSSGAVAFLGEDEAQFIEDTGADHQGHDWRSKYKDARGSDCCGESDCVKVQIKVLTEEFPFPEKIFIEATFIHGKFGNIFPVKSGPIEVPSKGVHMSEDEFAYWCHMYNLEAPTVPMIEMGETETRNCVDSKTGEVFVTEKCMRCVFLNFGG
jgi:hypothetical protein